MDVTRADQIGTYTALSWELLNLTLASVQIMAQTASGLTVKGEVTQC